jgi:hypothetical protein
MLHDDVLDALTNRSSIASVRDVDAPALAGAAALGVGL